VLYPNGTDHKFDMSCYCEKHIPMVKQLLGSALKGVAVEQGIVGGAPWTAAAYLAMGHLQFHSVERFQASFGPHGAQIVGDVPNYTNTQPIIQVSEIKL
jgi:uncharacterized protein (TIGR02118 family)